MKLRQKIRSIIFAVAALSVPGSAFASTNLICKADCPFEKIEIRNDKHACCPAKIQKNTVREKITQKCDNCIESRDLPVILNAELPLLKVEAAAISETPIFTSSPKSDAKFRAKFLPENNLHFYPKSVSITLQRFLI
jgi:hypothetical protein